MSQENYKGIIEILKEVRDIIDSPDTDVAWSRYNTVEEVVEDLELHIKKMTINEESAIENLKVLFAPTGSLQEISISSGWGCKFLEIASRFDKLSR